MLSSLKHKITETYDILGHRTFLFASLTIAFYIMSKVLRVTVMGWYIYKMTGNPVHLGFIGLAEALPYIITNPIGGYLADRYGRKRQSTILTLLTIALTAHLCWLVSRDFSASSLIQIYIDFCLFGAVRGTFGSGAMSSLIALSVPRKQFQKANAWNGTFTQTGMVLGPVMGGLIYNFYGVVWANAVVLLFMLVILVFLYFIVDTPVIRSDVQMSEWQNLTVGFRFIFTNPPLRATVVLDFIAVIFSGVTGLLPVFAHDILHLGPDGLGYLRAAIQLGSVCAGLVLAHYPMRNYVGRQYVMAVIIFCFCLLVFAYSTSFYLSFAMLFLSGFSDWYGSVIRGTISRLLTPEALQGRVTSARLMFATSGNEISTFESGLVAGLIGPVPSVVFGVAATLLATVVIWHRTPSVKALHMSKLLEEIKT